MQQDVAQHRGGRTPTRHPGCLEQTWQGSLLALGVRGSFLSVKLHQRHLLIRRAHLLAESCYTKLLPESVSCMSKVKTVPVIAHPAQGCSSPFAAPAAPRELPGRGAVSQLRLVVGPRHGAGSAELRAALRAHTHGTGRFEAPLPLVHAPREAGAGPRSRAEFCSSSRHRWPRSGVCLRAPNVCLRAARSEHSNKRGMLRNSSLVPC